MFGHLGEIVGTFFLVLFGLGGHTGVLAHGLPGIWQVAIVLGLAITMAIYTTSALSGTHIVNARVEMAPEGLESLVRDSRSLLAAKAGIVCRVEHMQTLRPGRPRPTHRYATVVPQAGR